jgi:hypothetical protein
MFNDVSTLAICAATFAMELNLISTNCCCKTDIKAGTIAGLPTLSHVPITHCPIASTRKQLGGSETQFNQERAQAKQKDHCFSA